MPNAASIITEIDAAQAQLHALQERADALAASIGEGVVPRFRRRNLTNDTSKGSFGLTKVEAVLAEGRPYVKTRDAVEPVRSAKE